MQATRQGHRHIRRRGTAMSARNVIHITTVTLAICGAGLAQESRPSEPDLFDQVLAQENQSSESLYGFEQSLISIHGFLDMKYMDFDGANSGFDLHHVNLFLSGQLSEQVEAYMEVEYEHASESIELDQAEIRVHPYPQTDLTIGAGRFYAPFGIERHTWYPSLSPLVSRPEVFRQVAPGNWYETGVRAEHHHQFEGIRVSSEFALSDGLGSTANTSIRDARQFRDSNNNRAVTARVGVSFDGGPAFGVSGATMKYDPTDDDEIEFFGVDGEYGWGRLLLRAEWVESRVEDTGGAVGDFRRSGWYLLGSYNAIDDEKFRGDLTLRVDSIDQNSKVDDNTDRMLYSIGARAHMFDNMNIKLEYQAQHARHGLSAASEHGVQLQCVIDF